MTQHTFGKDLPQGQKVKLTEYIRFFSELVTTFGEDAEGLIYECYGAVQFEVTAELTDQQITAGYEYNSK